MTQGFPKHMVRFAAHAARKVHAYGISHDANEPFHFEGGYYYLAADGQHIAIPDFAKYVGVEEAFNEVLAASWGEALHCPIAPVAFDVEEASGTPTISSFSVFPHSVTTEIVLEKAARGNGLNATLGDHDMNNWIRLIDASGSSLALDQMEQVLFSRTKGALSRLIPFVNWIGGGDPDTSNLIIDTDGLLHALAHKTSPKPVGMYMCDFTDSQLSQGYKHADTPVVDTQLNRAPLCNLATFLHSWPTVAKQLERLFKADDGDGIEHDDEDMIAPLINPLFAPHLDFAALRHTMQHIASFDNTLIHGEMRRIADRMAEILHEPEDIAKLYAYASYKADVLILRRDLLSQHMEPLLAFEGASKPRGNLFSRLTRAVDKHLRPHVTAKRPRKPRTPKPPSSTFES